MNLRQFFSRAGAGPTQPGSDAEAGLLASLLTLAWVVEARDPYTGGHLWRVARYAALLCERTGTPPDQCARITIGGFLHDLGKVGVPDAILRKPGALSEDEYTIVKTHPEVGARLVTGHPLGHWVGDAVLLHHERPDGRGYPQGMQGADIPVAARVIGICDAFDAMTSTRPYRAGWPIAQALEVMGAQLGRQFDECLGRQFIALAADGLLDHIAGHSDDGIPLQRCLVCGPTLVLRREQGPGDIVFCRNCGAAYRLEGGAAATATKELLTVVPTGRRGSPADLAPIADAALIQRFVHETARDALARQTSP
jgi:hypothetical protein